jgi:hypothetical protein
MQLVGYDSHIIKIEQFQEGGGDNLDIYKLAAYHNSYNRGEVNSKNDGYKHHNRETINQNPNSSTMSQRITSSRMNNKTSGMDTRKTPVGGSICSDI